MRRIILPVAAALLLAGCGEAKPQGPDRPTAGVTEEQPDPQKPPERVMVDQILIAFDKSRLTHPRSRTDAEALARSLYSRVRGGADFELLKQKYTDYRLKTGEAANPVVACNAGVSIRTYKEVPYQNLWSGWAEVVFSLKPGEYGFVPYHEQQAGDGYHIVRRLR